uniref:Air1 domain containing protein n=1 Tax=Platynereis dumerilii TaxID=6359 RepID=C7SB51_PLADU|nr:Air1 domain containing protein [Platynereis dumerilii]
MESKYNINTASKEELMLIEGVNELAAMSIIQYREDVGKITSWYTVKTLAPRTSLDNFMDLHDSGEWSSDIKDFPFRFKIDPPKDNKSTIKSESESSTKLGQANAINGQICNGLHKERPLNSTPSNVLSSLDKDGTDYILMSSSVQKQEVKPAPVPGGSNSSNIDSHYLNLGSKFSNLVYRKLVKNVGRRVNDNSTALCSSSKPHQKSMPKVEKTSSESFQTSTSLSSKKTRTNYSNTAPPSAGNASTDKNFSPVAVNKSVDGVLPPAAEFQFIDGTLTVCLPEAIINGVKRIQLVKPFKSKKEPESSPIPSPVGSPHSAPTPFENLGSGISSSEVPKPRPWKPRTCFECGGAGHLAPHCPTRHQRSIHCFECEGVGHPAPQCSSRRHVSIICHQCRGRGHIAKNCAFSCGPASHFSPRRNITRGYECWNYGHIARNCIDSTSSIVRASNYGSYHHGPSNFNSSLRRLPNQDFKTGSDSQDWRATMRGRI